MPYGIDGKDVDEVSFFGRLFDFNRDGETDFSEELLGLGMIAAVAGAAEEEEQLQRELDEELEEEEDEEMEQAIRASLAEMSSFDADDYEEESESVIRAKLAELEDKLLDWECEEPDDVLGSAYDAWEEGREQLEDAISDLEDLLDE